MGGASVGVSRGVTACCWPSLPNEKTLMEPPSSLFVLVLTACLFSSASLNFAWFSGEI